MGLLKIAACGIDCNECGQYKVTAMNDADAAEDLTQWFRGMGWIGEGDGAEAVLKMAPLCKGCRNIDDDCFWKCGGGDCGLRLCCEERQLGHCGECVEFPCGEYKKFGEDGLPHHRKAMAYLQSLKKAEAIVNGSTMHTVGGSGRTADWVMALTDEEGYPAASMITAARADGFQWIAFCVVVGQNKYKRAEKDPRSCVYLFDKDSFSGISLTGRIQTVTDPAAKRHMWYDALGEHFSGPGDNALCVLRFTPERYNIFIDGRTIRGVF